MAAKLVVLALAILVTLVSASWPSNLKPLRDVGPRQSLMKLQKTEEKKSMVVMSTAPSVRSDPVTLADGVPVTGTVQQSQFSYYMFQTAKTQSDITFTVTPSFGDPDMYVACEQLPTLSNYRWRATGWGEDQIEIRAGQGCGTQHYFVGIYGSFYSDYTLTGVTSDNFVTLIDGVPFQGHVDTGKYQMFKFRTPSGNGVRISTTAAYGDPDLFVNCGPQFPSSSDYKWTSQRFGPDMIQLADQACPGNVYYISVYGFQGADFSVLGASVTTAITLTEGMPMTALVSQDQGIYFQFRSLQRNDTYIALTTLAGDASIYVSCGNGTRPDPVHFYWTNNNAGVFVSHMDPYFCGASSDTSYAIGVFGNRANSRVMVSATSRSARTTLYAGLPTTGILMWGTYTYYEVLPSDSSDLIISVNTEDGSYPYTYVSTTTQWPNRNSYQWTGTTVVRVPKADPTLTYYIGVIGADDFLPFSIGAESVDTITTLLPSKWMELDLQQEQRQYFVVYQPFPVTTLNFTLGATAGNPDAYLGCTYDPFPDPTHYTWMVTAQPGAPGQLNVDNLGDCANAPAIYITVVASDSASSLYLQANSN